MKNKNHMDKVREMIKNKAYNFTPRTYSSSDDDSGSENYNPTQVCEKSDTLN